jgi:hypothetical protein
MLKMNSHLEKRLATIEDTLDDQEQYSRRNCIVVHGLPERDNENIEDVVVHFAQNKLGFSRFKVDLIDRCHRIGKPRTKINAAGASETHPRAVIIKLVAYRCRSEMWRNKSKLKRSGIKITESLTSKRLNLLRQARDLVGPFHAWTDDGRILANHNGVKVRILTKADLLKLQVTATATKTPSQSSSNM